MSQSTAMVVSRCSVYLATFYWASLTKHNAVELFIKIDELITFVITTSEYLHNSICCYNCEIFA